MKGKLSRAHQTSTEMQAALDAVAVALAQDKVEEGVDLLCGALEMLLADQPSGTCRLVVRDCVAQMEKFGAERPEYVVLALLGLDCGLGGG